MRRHFQPSLKCSEYQVSHHLFVETEIPIGDIFCVIFLQLGSFKNSCISSFKKVVKRQVGKPNYYVLHDDEHQRKSWNILGQNFANNEETFKAQCLWFLPKNVQQLKTKTNVPILQDCFFVWSEAQKRRTLVCNKRVWKSWDLKWVFKEVPGIPDWALTKG